MVKIHGSKMDNCKRRFLQTMMSQKVLNTQEVMECYRTCCEKYDVPIPDETGTGRTDHVKEIVKIINNNISAFGMEIKKGKDELEGEVCFGMVNTTESSITLFASQYTDNELEFFKKLVEMIVMSEKGTVGSITAIDITDSLTKKMSKTNAEDLLDRLQKDKWLGKTQEGKLYLSCRGMMELGQYIFNIYGDVAVRCNMCKQLCLQGQKCGSCDAKLHNYCAKKIFSKSSTEKICPACQCSWDSSGVSDESRPSTPAPSTSSSVSSTSSRTRKRKATR